MALEPAYGVAACVAAPRTSSVKVSAPAAPVTSVPLVGSVITQALPVWPRRSVPNAPSPPSSSPMTRCTASPSRSRTPDARIARTAARLATTPAFMSTAPRPCSRPPRIVGSNGAVRQCARSPGGTTSTWPCSTKPGTASSPAQVPTSPQPSLRSASVPGKPSAASSSARSIAQRSTSRPSASRSLARSCWTSHSASEPLMLGTASRSTSELTTASRSIAASARSSARDSSVTGSSSARTDAAKVEPNLAGAQFRRRDPAPLPPQPLVSHRSQRPGAAECERPVTCQARRVTASRRTASPERSGAEAAPRPLHQLTGLRLFAALAVYFSHVAAPAGSPDWLRALQKSGYAGVTFFFVLSGFVLALNYFDKLHTPRQVWSYAAARIARVYPLYLVALCWPAVHLWAAGTLPESHLLQKVLGIQAWNPDLHVAFGFLGPAWSISVELFLYATLPLLVPVVRLLDRRLATLLTAIALVLAALFVLAWLFDAVGRGDLAPADPASAHRWLYRTPLTRVGDFLIGVLAARIFVRILHRRANGRLGTWLVPLAIAATLVLAAQPALVNTAWSWDAMYAVPAVALILGLA